MITPFGKATYYRLFRLRESLLRTFLKSTIYYVMRAIGNSINGSSIVFRELKEKSLVIQQFAVPGVLAYGIFTVLDTSAQSEGATASSGKLRLLYVVETPVWSAHTWLDCR